MIKPKMAGFDKLKIIRMYCDYVEEHLKNISAAWIILQEKIKHENVIYDDFLFWQTHIMIENHDMSKMSAEEFIQYAEWFYEKYGKQYDMFNDGGHLVNDNKRAKTAFDAAWEHHLLNNSHHWQNWTKAGERFPNESACCCVCMVADWMAMGMKFGDTAEEYYNREKNNIYLPEWAELFIKRIFEAIRL